MPQRCQAASKIIIHEVLRHVLDAQASSRCVVSLSYSSGSLVVGLDSNDRYQGGVRVLLEWFDLLLDCSKRVIKHITLPGKLWDQMQGSKLAAYTY